jgi:hypothetical protein
MITKYVFEVKYEQWWQEQDEPTSGYMCVAVNVYDAQKAIDKVRQHAMQEESECLLADGKNFAKCIGFSLSSVQHVTDFEEVLESASA